MAKGPESGSKSFLFRDLDSNILIGTASDRYAGWIGQIYSEERYEKGITRRSHKVGDKTFNEETLPVESVAEYFEHFPLLEIDYTFYRLLLEKDGKPTPNFHAQEQLQNGNAAYFAGRLPHNQYWRFFPEFINQAVMNSISLAVFIQFLNPFLE